MNQTQFEKLVREFVNSNILSDREIWSKKLGKLANNGIYNQNQLENFVIDFYFVGISSFHNFELALERFRPRSLEISNKNGVMRVQINQIYANFFYTKKKVSNL